MYPFLVLREAVQQVLEAMPRTERAGLCQAIADLTLDPRPRESTALAGYTNAFRLRLGRWRILYEVNEQIRSVIIARVERRGPQTYRGLEDQFGPRRRRS